MTNSLSPQNGNSVLQAENPANAERECVPWRGGWAEFGLGRLGGTDEGMRELHVLARQGSQEHIYDPQWFSEALPVPSLLKLVAREGHTHPGSTRTEGTGWDWRTPCLRLPPSQEGSAKGTPFSSGDKSIT